VVLRFVAFALIACGRYRFDPIDGGALTSDAFSRDGSVDVSCIKQIDAGFMHVCILANDGRIWCWGFGNNYQLGDSSLASRSYPARAFGFPANPLVLSLGGYHSCVVDSLGGLQCLGANYRAQLAMGATGPAVQTTVPISLPASVQQSAAGEESHCALLVDGRVYCWGSNFDGEVGDGSPMNVRGSPSQATISGVVELAHQNHHVCARDMTQIYCWGDNTFYQIGDGSMTDRRSPTPIGYLGNSLAVGDHTCMVVNGAMQCWGANGNGQLGDNTVMDRATPAPVQNLPMVQQLALGYHHSCAIDLSNSLWCWGQNNLGQVGNGSQTDQRLPVRVLDNVISAVAGWNFTCAQQATAVKCWGGNEQGQLGTNSSVTNVTVPTDTVFSCDVP
jgi:alpha-tubulin suppressor-like RCC1 family protein